MPFLIIPLIGLGISYFTLKESKKSNTLGLVGLGIGAVSTLVMMLMLFMQTPSNEKEFDLVNYYEDGIFHYTGNGTFENREDIWKWYSMDGILVKIEFYDDNQLDGEYKEFYKNGNVKIIGQYSDGQKEIDSFQCFKLDGSSNECSKYIGINNVR